MFIAIFALKPAAVYKAIFIEKPTSPISPNNTVYLMNFYRGFTVFTNRFSRRHTELRYVLNNVSV